MIALRILSYAGDYLEAKPTLDRCTESVEKLLEDLYSKVQPPNGERRAIVEVGEPIDLREHLESYQANARQCVGNLTVLTEARVQTGLDAINNANTTEGASLF